jgi:hypothetical protein
VDAGFTEYLPTAVAYRLRPGRTLIMGMGIEVLSALQHRMPQVTVLEPNPLVNAAAQRFAGDLLTRGPALRTVVEHPRTYLARTRAQFEVIQVPPQESFQVVASGAFSLTEQYLYTVEAVRDYLGALAPRGVLAMTRWIQTPPSEEIRTWAAAIAALEKIAVDRARRGQVAVDPASCLAVLRSLNTITILIDPDGFTRADIGTMRTFAAARRFDITFAPGVGADESNRYNVLPVDNHRKAFLAVLDPAHRDRFLRDYPFDVRPIHDDRPFFFHFFRWRQVPQTLGTLGRTWQPFGGGGYLILIALLAISVILSAVLILLPLRIMDAQSGMSVSVDRGARRGVLVYFVCLGLAYLFVEIPLLQQMILVLGSPTYAAAAVLSGLLVASGIGSLLAARLGRRWTTLVAAVAVVAIGLAWGLPRLVDAVLGLSLTGRLTISGVLILLPGLLMGVPFPSAIQRLAKTSPHLVPWAWGINGCASVVGAVLAAIIALEWGFRAVLLLGGFVYAAAWVIVSVAGWTSPA